MYVPRGVAQDSGHCTFVPLWAPSPNPSIVLPPYIRALYTQTPQFSL